jgi:purine nucleosidase
MPDKILVDTDIGSDLDDALCLAYLLANPDCELVGITTVTGQPEVRAHLASVLCMVAGKDVPIVVGAAGPLTGSQLQTEVPQASALVRWPHRTDHIADSAESFLSKTIRAYPGEITLLSIGPLTNIANAIAYDPELPHLVRGLVGMCGVFGPRENTPDIEWNARLDPAAARRVYDSNFRAHRSIGLDVTHQVAASESELRALAHQAPLLIPVLDFAGPFYRTYREVYFHDPLAAATIFEPTLCTYAQGTVTVETQHSRAGTTNWDPDPDNGRHEIATQVDVPAFLSHYTSVLNTRQ